MIWNSLWVSVFQEKTSTIEKWYTYYSIYLQLYSILKVLFFVFIFYSFYKIEKSKFVIRYEFFQDDAKLFTCLEMPVNITQYRGPVGIFNNRNFVFLPKFTNFIDHKCWNTNHLYLKQHLSIFLINLAFFSRFCKCSSFTKVQFLCDFKKHLPIMLVITTVLLFDCQFTSAM